MLYFIRHAQTLGNIQGVWVGRSDQPVHSSAFDGLERVAIELSEIQFDEIYTSPLLRAKTTAEYIAKHQKRQILPVVTTSIMERDFAEFEGVAKSSSNRALLEHSHTVETVDQIKQRLEPFILQQLARPEKILLVSHSAVFRYLKSEMNLQGERGVEVLGNLEWEVFK